jgi:Flp pilus assembly protein TadD
LIGRISALLARATPALVLTIVLGASQASRAQTCTGPAPLEARIHAQPTAPAYSELGNWFIENHKANCAVQAFQSALKLEPGSKKIIDGLAKAFIAAGDDDTVITQLRNAPRDENLTLDLSNAYSHTGQMDEAIQVLADGLKTYPASNALTEALTGLDIRMSHFEQAFQASQKLATLKPNDMQAQRIYLRTMVITDKTDTAAPLGVKLLALAPHDSDLLNLNGYIERKAGNYDAARKHLEEAVALNPNDYNPRVNLGLVLVAVKDAPAAKIQLQTALGLGATEPQVRFELAKVLRTLGETEEAAKQLKLYQQELQHQSDQYQAMLKSSAAAQAEKAGDKRKAADLYREASTLAPENAILSYRLSLVLEQLGDVRGERAALELTVKSNPRLGQAQYALGYLEFQAGDNAAAERQFRATVEVLPNNAQAWISLAATLAKQGRFDEAQDATTHALKLEPDNPIALKMNERLAAVPGQR